MELYDDINISKVQGHGCKSGEFKEGQTDDTWNEMKKGFGSSTKLKRKSQTTDDGQVTGTSCWR